MPSENIEYFKLGKGLLNVAPKRLYVCSMAIWLQTCQSYIKNNTKVLTNTQPCWQSGLPAQRAGNGLRAHLKSWGVACTGAAKCAGMILLKSQLLQMSSTHLRVCTHRITTCDFVHTMHEFRIIVQRQNMPSWCTGTVLKMRRKFCGSCNDLPLLVNDKQVPFQ